MSYFFKTNDFNLEHYDFDINCSPQFTKKEQEFFQFLLKDYDFKSKYSEKDLILNKYKVESIKKLIPNLLKKVVHCYIINEKNEKFEICFNLFDYVIFEGSKIIYNFSNEIKNSKNLGNFFARINIVAILQFKSTYTKHLFKAIISSHKKKETMKYSIEEFKELLGIKSDQYNRYYNFENKVLNPIIKDLEKSEITLWFEKIKNTPAKTSRVVGIKIHYKNQQMSRLHKDTNTLIRNYSDKIKDFAAAYEKIYNYKKYNSFEDTQNYIEENKEYIFGED